MPIISLGPEGRLAEGPSDRPFRAGIGNGENARSTAVSILCLLALLLLTLPGGGQTAHAAAPADYFRINVVDSQTGRGVPLVELRTVNEIRFLTDSNGIVAVGEPDLMGQKVYFRISSPGYTYPKDGFGYRGIALDVKPGSQATIKIERINIAERLYRLTGSGIYRDSVLVGAKVPLAHPLLDGLVMGQDTVEVTPYNNKLYWFFGDTERPAYPLGQFATSGATSPLPSAGGLDPATGVDLTYWVDGDGFSKKMSPIEGAPGPVWVGGLFTLFDGGRERLFTRYAEINHDGSLAATGLAEFDDQKALFTSIHVYDKNNPLVPEGHPFFADSDGRRYVYFEPTVRGAFPLVRTVADRAHVTDATTFEAFTCLAHGARFEGANTKLDRDAKGALVWAWKANTAPLGDDQTPTLVKAGKMKADEALLQLRDIETDKPVSSHGGSVFWNPYRQRWIQITTEVFGSPSFLGEVWFSEADTPVGPWTYARKIVTHDHYTFYNPTQHPFFDQDGGRLIYFEGTYTDTYSDVKDLAPRYNYNQLMYRLSLDDARLALPQPVYRVRTPDTKFGIWAMRSTVAGQKAWANILAIPFYALPPGAAHRPDGAVPVSVAPDGSLYVGGTSGTPLFYALPANAANGEKPSSAAVPLYEYKDVATGHLIYATGASLPNATRTGDAPLCRVWRNPSTVLAFDPATAAEVATP